MTSKDFSKQIICIYKEAKEQLDNLKVIEISGDNMINSDMEKTIKALAFQKIDELIRRIKK